MHLDTLFASLFLLCGFTLFSQEEIQQVEPPLWWHGMRNPYLEIMIHGSNIGGLSPKSSSKLVTIVDYESADSPNYLFVGVDISKVKTHLDFEIILEGKGRKIKVPYSLHTRLPQALRSRGISAKDAIYLITPDRFRNSNLENDQVEGYKEGHNRVIEYGRHGGDLEGIAASIDYIKDLGFNTIWLNPVLENDMKESSYHGYATTDYFKVDERFGGNIAYTKLRDELADNDMHLIMDMIANHCGSSHWWMDDLPFKDWLNHQEEYLKNPAEFAEYSNHRKSTILDPYRSDADRDGMTDGWFVKTMPDLNQRNPHMATYTIQNSIWWVEYMNLAGIRQDTYSYPDEFFLSDWSCSLHSEFPNLFIVGEEWSENPVVTSYWQAGEDKSHKSSVESCLPSVMDFPLQMTVSRSLNDEETWNQGFGKMYEMLMNDVMYTDPMKLVIFPDNHDMSRVYTQLNEDYNLWKMAMNYYATMRGIPQIYYGTEILMSNKGTESHDVIRTEFPGGWKDHPKSAFSGTMLSDLEKTAQNHITTLFNWRKQSNAVHNGDLVHYIPKDGVYVYFRILDTEQVMVILNKNSETYDLDLSRFDDQLEAYTQFQDIFTTEFIQKEQILKLPARSSMIYSMKL